MKIITLLKITTGVLLFSFIGCKNNSGKKEVVTNQIETTYSEEELYRPNFHFTPIANWMNDPNGMFFLDDTYHLFYQYYPDGNKWGPMHWGHATSEDLIDWEEQEIALYPDDNGYIFSGSCVVDHDNTSGLGDGKTPPVIAMFTYHNPIKEKEEKVDVESQGIAYSLDKGKTWMKYNNNPVIKNPGIRDFRDPKVIWDADRKQWIMVLAANDRTQFYKSNNLLEWAFLSEFGAEFGAHGGVWECPDFFPMTVEGTNEKKWVLLQSLNPGGPNGGSATQYFVGDFDGVTFSLDSKFKKQLAQKQAVWFDYGMDNYASVTWNNTNEEYPIAIGWMSNWLYAQVVPTNGWRSSMTIPRTLKLTQTANDYTIISAPVNQIKKYFTETISIENIVFKEVTKLGNSENLDLSKSVIDIELNELHADTYTFSLSNKKGDVLKFGLNNSKNYLFIDRSASGKIDFSNEFSNKLTKASLSKALESAKFKIILDKTSIEIFFNEGKYVLTEIFFPEAPFDSLTIESSGKKANVSYFKANKLAN